MSDLERFMKWMKFKDISQKKISERSGLNTTRVNNYLLKSTKGIKIDFIKAVSEGFPDLNIHWWITGKGKMLYSQMGKIDDKETMKDINKNLRAIINDQIILKDNIVNYKKEVEELREEVKELKKKIGK